jgi:hypothetical protein
VAVGSGRCWRPWTWILGIHLAKTRSDWQPERAFALFDALCEELADLGAVRCPRCQRGDRCLSILAPSDSAESPYPKDLHTATLDASGEGLLLLVEGRLAAETAAVALAAQLAAGAAKDCLTRCSGAMSALALLPMLESVRDKSRSLLMQSV